MLDEEELWSADELDGALEHIPGEIMMDAERGRWRMSGLGCMFHGIVLCLCTAAVGVSGQG